MEYTPNLRTMYSGQITNNLKGNYKSVMQVPKLIKICLNQGVGSATTDKKQIEAAQQEMSLITGQKAVLTKSRKDISNFKCPSPVVTKININLTSQCAINIDVMKIYFLGFFHCPPNIIFAIIATIKAI